MKSNIKNIVVCMESSSTKEFEVDTDLFDDPYIEALTRAVEENKLKIHLKIRPGCVLWDKDEPKIPYTYNSYFAMLNAGMYKRAELLREEIMVQYDIDLSKEPICSHIKAK